MTAPTKTFLREQVLQSYVDKQRLCHTYREVENSVESQAGQTVLYPGMFLCLEYPSDSAHFCMLFK